jgi:hypothetical protein
MSSSVYEVSGRRSNAGKTIFWGGLIAGTLDITGACVVSYLRAGVLPVRVFQSVAAGLYGAASSSLGVKTAVIGLILHYSIATTWTVVYYTASRKISFLIKQPIISGLLYGVIVYSFMNFVVIPLSAIPKRPTPAPLSGRLIGLSIIIVCIGLPIAFIVRKFSK